MKELDQDEKKDLRVLLLKDGIALLIFLLIFAGLYTWVYFETRENPTLFLVAAIIFAVLIAFVLFLAITPVVVMFKNLKDIAAKRYERILKRSLFWAHWSFGGSKESYWGNAAMAYLFMDKTPEAKECFLKVHQPVLLETYAEMSVLFSLAEGRNDEAKNTYSAYALRHRNGKTAAERNTVTVLDALFNHLEGKEVTPEQAEKAEKEDYPLYQRLYAGSLLSEKTPGSGNPSTL